MKIGDKVICTHNISPVYGGPQKGERFTIVSISNDKIAIGFKLMHLRRGIGLRSGAEDIWN